MALMAAMRRPATTLVMMSSAMWLLSDGMSHWRSSVCDGGITRCGRAGRGVWGPSDGHAPAGGDERDEDGQPCVARPSQAFALSSRVAWVGLAVSDVVVVHTHLPMRVS